MLRKSIAGLAMCLLAFVATAKNKNAFTISENYSARAFTLFNYTTAASICTDTGDATVPLSVLKDETVSIKVYLLDTGLALSKVDIRE